MHVGSLKAVRKAAVGGFILLASLSLTVLTASSLQSLPTSPSRLLGQAPSDADPHGLSLRLVPSPGLSVAAIFESFPSQLQLPRPGNFPRELTDWPSPRFLAQLTALGQLIHHASPSVSASRIADGPGLSTCCPQGPPTAG